MLSLHFQFLLHRFEFEDLSMTGEEKKEALKPLDEQITVAATQGMIYFLNKLKQLEEDKQNLKDLER